MKIAKFVTAVFIAIFILNACTSTPSITPTKTAVPTSTAIASSQQDAIFFWWHEKDTNQLWKFAPNGASEILYEIPSTLSISEALNSKLITQNGAQALKEFATEDRNPPILGPDEISLQITPYPLQISPDRTRIAWGEPINYCNSYSDLLICEGETIIRVLNLQTKEVEIGFNIPIEEEFLGTLRWSPDSRKLAYHTHPKSLKKRIIYTFNIVTNKTTRYQTLGDFTWASDSNHIIISKNDGFHLLNLDTQGSKHILDGQWQIFDARVSPGGDSLIFAGIQGADKLTSTEHELIYMLDLKTYKLQPVTNENRRDWIDNLQWLQDGKHIIYTQKEPYTSPPNQIFVRKASTGEIVFTENIPVDVDGDLQISQDGRKLLFLGKQYGLFSLMIYDLNQKEWKKVPFPSEIQTIVDKGLKEVNHQWKYRLWSATW